MRKSRLQWETLHSRCKVLSTLTKRRRCIIDQVYSHIRELLAVSSFHRNTMAFSSFQQLDVLSTTVAYRSFQRLRAWGISVTEIWKYRCQQRVIIGQARCLLALSGRVSRLIFARCRITVTVREFPFPHFFLKRFLCITDIELRCTAHKQCNQVGRIRDLFPQHVVFWATAPSVTGKGCMLCTYGLCNATIVCESTIKYSRMIFTAKNARLHLRCETPRPQGIA